MGTFGLFTNFSTDFSTVEIQFFTVFALRTFRHRFGADSGTLLGSVLEPISALVLWSFWDSFWYRFWICLGNSFGSVFGPKSLSTCRVGPQAEWIFCGFSILRFCSEPNSVRKRIGHVRVNNQSTIGAD
jgi:hypothetical protein